MQEMLETAAILQLASSSSLVIVDEMGRGTSTDDGLGLCYATAERLARLGCFSLFATHFHDMARLQQACSGVVNRHVTAAVQEGGRLQFLYEVRDGASQQSFGVQCMEMAGFDSDVVLLARQKLRDFEQDRELRRKRRTEAADATEAEQLRKALEAVKARAATLKAGSWSGTEEERAAERESIRSEAQRLLQALTQHSRH